jgi:hypothetical protein
MEGLRTRVVFVPGELPVVEVVLVQDIVKDARSFLAHGRESRKGEYDGS